MAGLRQGSALGRVEVARCPAGAGAKAAGAPGAPPTGLPALVASRLAKRVTGGEARTESRSLATRGPTPQEVASPLGAM
jgi:hypothetical protein